MVKSEPAPIEDIPETNPTIPDEYASIFTNDEEYDVEIDDLIFRMRALSGFRYMKLYAGNSSRETSELYRELILASMIKPILSREQIEELKYIILVKLGTAIIKHQEQMGKN